MPPCIIYVIAILFSNIPMVVKLSGFLHLEKDELARLETFLFALCIFHSMNVSRCCILEYDLACGFISDT